MKKIKDLIKCNFDIDILGVTDDSRNVREGYLFVATKGYNEDHFDYIDDAINNGCSFIICDREIDKDFPHIVVDKINDVFFDICLKYYDVDLNHYKFMGVTGTDGKTTTATVVSKIIDNCAYIGTNGFVIDNVNYGTNNTTPCISELYEDLKIIKEKNCSNVMMEVSSEALLHDRVKNIKYDIVGFTNITGDHLNVHKTFDNYIECKLKLLNYLKNDGICIVNGDDDILRKVKCQNIYTYGFNEDNDFVIFDDKYNKDFTYFSIKYKENIYKIKSPLKCKYNVYNVCLGFIMGLFYGIDSKTLISNIKKLEPINGRCEFLDFGQNFDIVLDYAHTINGIKTIIESFKDYKDVIVVTGCAGGREKDKRPVIGSYIIDNVDKAIFTMDDPRYEDVDDIIDDMVGDKKDYFRIVDRKEAINFALSIANMESVVLILGKGRDNYMAIEDKKIKYCDYDVIKGFFED